MGEVLARIGAICGDKQFLNIRPKEMSCVNLLDICTQKCNRLDFIDALDEETLGEEKIQNSLRFHRLGCRWLFGSWS